MSQKRGGIVTGVAWYRREQWDRLLAVSADRDMLEPTFDEWLSFAEDKVKALERQGVRLQKVDVDVDELISWCRAQNRKVDGPARTRFVIEKVRKADRARKRDRL